MEQTLKYCNHLYDDTTDGWLQVRQFVKCEEDEKEIKVLIKNTKNDGLRDILSSKQSINDVFVTINTHYKPCGKIESIRQFRALYIDLDSKIYDKSEMIYMVYDLVNEGKIPEPTMITDSGNGLHLYWRIKNAPYRAIYTWQQIEDFLYLQLKDIGADSRATDASRILRIPGTINSKNGRECNIVFLKENLEYSMYDLKENYIPKKTKSKKEKKVVQVEFSKTREIKSKTLKSNKKKNKVINNFNSYSLHTERANDIKRLASMRNYDLTGYRNMAIHCYAYWVGLLIREKNEFEAEVKKFNNSLTEPLSDSEINAILECVPKAIELFIEYENGVRAGKEKAEKGSRNKKGYWYRNSTLIKRLDITEEEQKNLKTIISKEEKYRRKRESNNINQKERNKKNRRNELGLTVRQQAKMERLQEIIVMKEKGYKQTEIAKALGITRQAVSKLNKEIEDNNITLESLAK